MLAISGCGTTKQSQATEQMLASDAVDGAVSRVDFTPLAGQKVHFDTKYMQNYKGIGFVNAEYVISSLRQQMTAAGLLLQDDAKDAEYIIEGRIGTLGTDSHDVVYGIPSNSALSAAAATASAMSGAPIPGTIPELSMARRNDQISAAKIGLFAYERESREAIWQSGISVARSTSKDVWFLGIGPFQRGSIYRGKVQFAGTEIGPEATARAGINGTIVSYRDEMIFRTPKMDPTSPGNLLPSDPAGHSIWGSYANESGTESQGGVQQASGWEVPAN